MSVRDKFPIGRAALLRGLAFGRRGSVALPLITSILFFAAAALATTTNELSDAEVQGRQLARQLCELQPSTNFVQHGRLIIRDRSRIQSEMHLFFNVELLSSGWENICGIESNSKAMTNGLLIIRHESGKPNSYDLYGSGVLKGPVVILRGNQAMVPFASSDFWIADLGLEFFHWPGQKVLKHELRRSRACIVLESTNPDPSTNSYSRVVSWIDQESGGIVRAEAYDANSRLLKEFNPKSFKKVSGQWELQEMEIRNVQTGSRTRLEFDVKKE